LYEEGGSGEKWGRKLICHSSFIATPRYYFYIIYRLLSSLAFLTVVVRGWYLDNSKVLLPKGLNKGERVLDRRRSMLLHSRLELLKVWTKFAANIPVHTLKNSNTKYIPFY